MARIKWLTNYAGYTKGQEHDVADLKKLTKHIEKGRIEVLKAKPETGQAPQGENAMMKPEKIHTRKAPKK